MKKIAVIAVALVAALVVSVANSTATTSDASHCAYGKRFPGKGVIYLKLALTPRASAACGTFNARYFKGGRVFRKKLGTGVSYCRISHKTSNSQAVIGIYADSPASGRAFCRTFHPSWPRL
jgi:hypothetical protein